MRRAVFVGCGGGVEVGEKVRFSAVLFGQEVGEGESVAGVESVDWVRVCALPMLLGR
jgi:hypothetical protein